MKARWGIEVVGDEYDINSLEKLMSLPFDPFIESCEIRGKKCIILFSSCFESLLKPQSVYSAAKRCLNMIINLHFIEGHHFDVRPGAVWDFLDPDDPKATHVLEGMSITARPRIGIGTLRVFDKNGKLIPQKPKETFAQKAFRISQDDTLLALAIKYNTPDAEWVDLYKVYECISDSGAAKGKFGSKLKLFTHTANSLDDRHREGKFDSPPDPMSLSEARNLISEWLRAAALDDSSI